MASAQPGVWGIDLGQCALKAIRLTLVNTEVVATAFDYIEHPKILSQPDADPDQLTREALQQFLSRNQIRGDKIAISVPGQTGLARFVKLPPVEPKKIPDIVKFEAKQQIPFPLDEVVWDWQSLGTAAETEGFVENEIGLFAMKRDMVQRALQAFKDVDVEVHYVQMSPLALCNFVMFDVLGKGALEGKSQAAEYTPEEGLGVRNACVVVLDIGADNTNLVVTDGERIIWQRPIPIGGNHFTRALTKDLKLTFAKAEHLKRNATKAEDPKKIFQSMKPVFSDFVGELQRSLGFFTNTHRQASIKKIMGLGNAFRLPGLQKFISQSMGMDLHKLGAFRRLRGDEVLRSPVYGENVLSFGVAYGLALQGLNLTRLHTNLLPQEIQMDRMIRAKKPWVAAAAACLLLGITAFSLSAGSQFKVSDDAKIAAKKAEEVLQRHANYLKTFTEHQESLVKARTAAAAMMRGGQERVNWAMTLRYINECLPQPNGFNLPVRYVGEKNENYDPNCGFVKYWTADAQRAAERLKERDQQGLKDEIDLQHLIQINLQAVWARYCDPPMLNNWFNAVKSQAQDRDLLRAGDWDKPPEKPGWVLEVRGYTYHKGGLRFIMETFAENLRSGKPRWDEAAKKVVWEKGVVVPMNEPAGRWRKLDISHVAIQAYDHQILSASSAPGFKYITGGLWLNELVGGSRNSGSTAGSSGDVAAGGSTGGAQGINQPGAGDSRGGRATRGDWQGLGTAGSSGSPAGDAGAFVGRPGAGGVAGRGTSASATGEVKLKSGERGRTEFVIVFYWHEPLPTEPDPKNLFADANAPGGVGEGAPTGNRYAPPPPPSAAGGGAPAGGGGRGIDD